MIERIDFPVLDFAAKAHVEGTPGFTRDMYGYIDGGVVDTGGLAQWIKVSEKRMPFTRRILSKGKGI